MSFCLYSKARESFEEGMRVRVKTRKKYPSEDVYGEIGTIRKISGNSLGVKLDNRHNSRSGIGAYWFTIAEVEHVENDNENMEEKSMPNITNYLNVAKLKYISYNYDGAELSRYVANFDDTLQIGDTCAVNDNIHGMHLAIVIDILPYIDGINEFASEVIAKIDTAAYDNRVAARKKTAELKAKMAERAKQLQDIALYQMLAKEDPDMAALLKEYQDIPKV